jgi:hypothetical protein
MQKRDYQVRVAKDGFFGFVPSCYLLSFLR